MTVDDGVLTSDSVFVIDAKNEAVTLAMSVRVFARENESEILADAVNNMDLVSVIRRVLECEILAVSSDEAVCDWVSERVDESVMLCICVSDLVPV